LGSKGLATKTEFLGLEPVGIFQRFGPNFREERIGRYPLETGVSEQAVLSRLLRLDPRAFANVLRNDSQANEFGAHHQKAMALQRVFLSTHDRHRVILQFLLQALQPRPKRIGLSPKGVINEAVGAIGVRIIGAAAQFLAEEQVSDVFGAQKLFKGGLAEMGQASALGHAADVGHHFNAVIFQKRDEVPEFQDGMADGEKRLEGIGFHRFSQSAQAAWRISASACLSRANSLGFQRFSPPILKGLQSPQERRFRFSRLRMANPHSPGSGGHAVPTQCNRRRSKRQICRG